MLIFINLDKDHGIVFCKQPLDSNIKYIEFKVIMNARSRGKSHLFIGLVDRSKYREENLISTFWKDSPSSLYWDVWSNKLIKTDENGFQIGSVTGYGCSCEEVETRIGIKYCHFNRSVSFIKDGINQGVAFKNIPIGLHPSLDVWFEVGSIEVIQDAFFEEKNYL